MVQFNKHNHKRELKGINSLMKHKKQTGFTIVELLIVIVVIGILAAITIVAFNGAQERARDTQRKQNLNDLAKVLQIYYIDNGNYVTTGAGAGNGQGWVNGGSLTLIELLQAAGVLTNTNIRDPQCNAGEVTGCSGYLKINCGSGESQRTILMARLESEPTGQPLPAEFTGCSSTSYWGAYQMNYFVEVG